MSLSTNPLNVCLNHILSDLWGNPNPERPRFLDILREIQEGGAAMNFFYPNSNSDPVFDENLQEVGVVPNHGFRRRLVRMAVCREIRI